MNTTRTYPRTLYGSQGAFRNAPEYASAIHAHKQPLFSTPEKWMVGLAIVVTVAACLGVFAV